jgi:hypothetical protein
MIQSYKAPEIHQQAYNCPFCEAYAQQIWNHAARLDSNYRVDSLVPNGNFSTCTHCGKVSLWLDGRMVYPTHISAPLPNADMPEDVKQDYEEARSIVATSPRGAAALLRLAVQKLCKHLGEPGENINTDIKSLVAKGLPEAVQQALDSVRVVGNNAVHPGQIDFTDNAGVASGLFAMLNFICENRITQPKMISQFYQATVPAETQGHINRRDGRP